MSILYKIAIGVALLMAGFATGYPIGQGTGFTTGSEWALMQADILAKEAGLFMPVRYEEGLFRLKLKQPRNLHKRAWEISDWHFEAMEKNQACERRLSEKVYLSRNTYMTQ